MRLNSGSQVIEVNLINDQIEEELIRPDTWEGVVELYDRTRDKYFNLIGNYLNEISAFNDRINGIYDVIEGVTDGKLRELSREFFKVNVIKCLINI